MSFSSFLFFVHDSKKSICSLFVLFGWTRAILYVKLLREYVTRCNNEGLLLILLLFDLIPYQSNLINVYL